MSKYTFDKATKNIQSGWLPFFSEEASKGGFESILNNVNNDLDKNIFPFPKNLLRSLFYCQPEEIKMVLIGQDPYHSSETINNKLNPHACGLSFSVLKKHKVIPPSLKNIYKEIKNCYPEYEIPNNGSIRSWAKKEKILLLNSSLTVIEKTANSHQHLWTDFTDDLIKFISDKNDSTIFLLMGNFAINKSKLIDEKKHKIFTCVHPSPLSAHNGFFGSNIFKKINVYLEDNNKEIINW